MEIKEGGEMKNGVENALSREKKLLFACLVCVQAKSLWLQAHFPGQGVRMQCEILVIRNEIKHCRILFYYKYLLPDSFRKGQNIICIKKNFFQLIFLFCCI